MVWRFGDAWVLLLCLLAGFGVARRLPAQEPRALFIEGYAGAVSYAQGEEAALHVSTTAAAFSVRIERWAATRELVWTNAAPLSGVAAPIPENASSHGCGWPVAVRVPIPTNWRSGYYHVTFSAAENGGPYTHRGRRTAESTCFFVVREAQPGRTSRILLQLSTHTYNAYNNWGGFSLYAYNGRGGNQGHRVSFLRPPASQYSNWEQPFVAWAESAGYTLEYAANGDLEHRPEMLTAYRLVLSVGHDEYWSSAMRDHLEAFAAKGGNLCFFSGNTCCWQVRSEDGGTALTCWKQNYGQDPLFPAGDRRLLSTLWSHHLVGRPENQLTGVGFLWGGYHRSHGQLMEASGAYTVHRPQHWVFEGTSLKRGDDFGGADTIVGYECDGAELEWREGLPFATGRDGTPAGFEVLATAPAQWHPDDSEWYDRWERGRRGAACLGTYRTAGGGTVFTCGATDWAHGLRGGDAHVVRITRNLLDRLGR